MKCLNKTETPGFRSFCVFLFRMATAIDIV